MSYFHINTSVANKSKLLSVITADCQRLQVFKVQQTTKQMSCECAWFKKQSDQIKKSGSTRFTSVGLTLLFCISSRKSVFFSKVLQETHLCFNVYTYTYHT